MNIKPSHFFCALALLVANPAEAQTVKLTTHNLSPYSYLENGALTGIAVEVVECAFNSLEGFEAEFIVVPWKRAQKMVVQNTADGFFAASHNLTRDEYAVMSEIIAEQNWTWYMLKENQTDPFSEDFKKNYVVSSFLGANMQKWLGSEGFMLANTPPTNNDQLLQSLINKRVDAILANSKVMEQLIEQYNVADSVHSVINKNKPLGVYFGNRFIAKNSDFLPEFNQAVLNCREEKARH